MSSFYKKSLAVFAVSLPLAIVSYAGLYYVYAEPASPMYSPLLAQYHWEPISAFMVISVMALTLMLGVGMVMAAWGVLGYKDE